MKTWKLLIASFGVAVCLQAADAERPATLFQRLGGIDAVRAVTDDFVSRILVDKRVNQWFAHAASTPEMTATYKTKLSDFVCQATGGPCKYSGMDMEKAHRGRGITSEAFDAVVENLVATLDNLRVPAQEKGQLLGLLAPLKVVIVQKQ